MKGLTTECHSQCRRPAVGAPNKDELRTQLTMQRSVCSSENSNVGWPREEEKAADNAKRNDRNKPTNAKKARQAEAEDDTDIPAAQVRSNNAENQRKKTLKRDQRTAVWNEVRRTM